MAVFSLLNPGDHVILSDDIYGGTFRIIGDVFGKYGIEHTYVDMSELDEVKAAIRPNTRCSSLRHNQPDDEGGRYPCTF